MKSQKKGQLTLQCDEMWSFVGSKLSKKRIWLALDQDSKEIVVIYVKVEITSVLRGYGNRYHQYIANALFVIRIFVLHTMKSYRKKDIVLLRKKAEKQATLNASISQ